MRQNLKVFTATATILIILLGLTNSLFPNPQVEFSSSNLPIVIIDTHGQEINDYNRIVADMGIIFNPDGQRNNVTDFKNNYNGKIAIEWRGSSSMGFPKKQYALETQDAAGKNLNVSLLGMPAENDWILNAPYYDRTMLRNVLIYNISNDLGMYASRTQYCELILNGDYRGVYILLEKIKRDQNRVNVSTLNSDEISGDDLTGGYIIKIDKLDGENVDGWHSPGNIYYQYHYPKPDEIVNEQKRYIQKYIANFEDVMNSDDWDDPLNGYPAIVDMNSFVDYFILNEFSRNIDAYRLSTFLYKDKDSIDRKMFAGPPWDYNLSLGDAFYGDDANIFEGWEFNHDQRMPNDSPKIPFWWIKIFHNHIFARLAADRWFSLRNSILHKDSLYQRIDDLAEYISEARIRNSARWSYMGGETAYMSEIERLKTWINHRLDWIDSNITTLSSVIPDDNSPVLRLFYLEQNYPNPFNPATTITFNNMFDIPVTLDLFDIRGNWVTNLVNSEMPAGRHQVELNANELTTGIYFYRLKSGNFTDMKKFTILK